MHTKVALGIEVTVRKYSCLAPPGQGFACIFMEQGHNTSFIEHVGFLANIWTFHLVNWFLEKLFVLSDQQLLDVL